MSLSWKLGRVAGIDLYLHPTFLLLPLLALNAGGGLESVALVAAVFGCVVLHEFGHALTARAFGIGTEDITLYPIGGVARLRWMPRSPGAELLITLAGPAVNVAIAAVLAASLGLVGLFDPGSAESAIGGFVAELMWVNVVLAAFNMLPAFPMDGGRVLRALLSGSFGRLRATEIAVGVGRALAVVLGLACLMLGLWMQAMLAAFIFFAAGAELNSVALDERRRAAQNGARDDEVIRTAPPGYRWVSRGRGAWQLVPIVVTGWDAPRRPWH